MVGLASLADFLAKAASASAACAASSPWGCACDGAGVPPAAGAPAVALSAVDFCVLVAWSDDDDATWSSGGRGAAFGPGGADGVSAGDVGGGERSLAPSSSSAANGLA